jgi:chromosome segregation ATPase
MLDLLELFIDHAIVTQEEIARRFGLHDSVELEAERDDVQALKEEQEEACGAIRGAIDKIEEALEAYGTYTFDESEGLDAALTALGDAVQGLLDDRSATKEQVSEAIQEIQTIITEIESNLGAEGEFTVDEEGGLANAIEQLNGVIQKLLDEFRAGGENASEDTY